MHCVLICICPSGVTWPKFPIDGHYYIFYLPVLHRVSSIRGNHGKSGKNISFWKVMEFKYFLWRVGKVTKIPYWWTLLHLLSPCFAQGFQHQGKPWKVREKYFLLESHGILIFLVESRESKGIFIWLRQETIDSLILKLVFDLFRRVRGQENKKIIPEVDFFESGLNCWVSQNKSIKSAF